MLIKVRKMSRILFFLAPCIIYVFIVRILPAFVSFYYSLSSWNILNSEKPLSLIGFQNYINIFQDTGFYNSLKITLIITVVATIIELVLGLILALIVDQKMRFKSAIRATLLIPMFITPVVVGTIWYILFHDTIGPINFLLSLIGVGHINWFSNTTTALVTIIVSDIWQWTPFIFILLLAALQSIDPNLYEAAEVDGASNLKKFRFITLPMLTSTMIIGAIMRSMDAFREFDKVFVMTGGGPGKSTEVLSFYIYKQAFTFYEMGYASALVIVSLAILSVIYTVFNRYLADTNS